MEDFTDERRLEYDLDTCDLEPIHTPGTIQPFGAIMAGAPDLSRIDYVSANLADVIGLAPETALGGSFGLLLDNDALHDTRNLLCLSTARTQRERVGRYDIGPGTFELYAHMNADGIAVVEFESVGVEEYVQRPIDQMRKFLAAASARPKIEQLLDVCVTGLQAMTGYDRVMAYRFFANGDGEVVSEARTPGTDSFLGQRYPAWDIPTQARALQVKNPLRMLSDVRQAPIPILARAENMAPLELGLAHLRGISPIHVEYLKNMGVGATMSIGLVVDGKLWGMFACHHNAPRVVTSDLRIAVELFGQMISLVIKQKMDLDSTARRHRAAHARERIIAETDARTDLLNSFSKLAPILADVIEADGLAITYEGKSLVHGSTPDNAVIRALSEHDTAEEDLILPLDNLSQWSKSDGADLRHTGGVLVIRATAAFPLQLMYFRDEVTRTLKWAGKPEKRKEMGPLGPRITPRGSFDAYMEQQRGFCPPWTGSDLAGARELQIMLTQITAKGDRVQLLRHKDMVSHQRQQDLMIAELNHRVKNILALIRSLSRQAKSSSASLESYALALEQRIAALAAAHDLAVSNSTKGVSLRGVLETELAPYLTPDQTQVLMTGPVIGLRADVAPMVALVIHEIVTNAAKYGALSLADGIARARWSQQEDGRLRFSWQEIGGPPVVEPERHGFGRSLIEKAIPYELDGQALLRFEPAGVRFDFELPADALVELDGETEAKLVGSVAKVEKVATGRTALIVEDNVVLAMDMVESLTRLGTETVETASTVESGRHMADRTAFDFAVLDMNLRGTVSFGLAQALREKGVPFLFVTGYGSSIDLPPELNAVPILTKPIDEGTLSKAIEQLLGT